MHEDDAAWRQLLQIAGDRFAREQMDRDRI
jgi:hypothetical protein